jgi:hypothetical protein
LPGAAAQRQAVITVDRACLPVAAGKIVGTPGVAFPIALGRGLLTEQAALVAVIGVAPDGVFLAVTGIDTGDEAVAEVVGVAAVGDLAGLAGLLLAVQEIALGVPEIAVVDQGVGIGGQIERAGVCAYASEMPGSAASVGRVWV